MIRFQEWLEMSGASTTGEVVQPSRGWIPGAEYSTYLMKAEILYVSNCTLVIESSPTVEGPWQSAATFGVPGTLMAVLSSEGGLSRFSHYIRWRVDPAAAEWGICFQLKAFPSKGMAEPNMGPRRV